MKKVIFRIDLLYVFLAFVTFISCFNNAYMNSFFPLSSLQTVFRYIICLICTVIIIFKHKEISKPFVYFIFLIVIFFISIVINSSNVKSAIFTFSFFITISIVLETVHNNDRCQTVFLYVWKYILIALVLIDVYTEVKYPFGLYSTKAYDINWFLGYKTERAVYSFPLLIITSYLSLRKNSMFSANDYAVFIIVFIDSYLSQGTVMTISFSLMIFLFCVSNWLFSKNKSVLTKRMFSSIINYKIVIIAYAIILFLLLFSENSQFISFISDFFNKDSGISSRDVIWSRVLSVVRPKLIFGSGFLTHEQYVYISGFIGGSNAHNALLTLLVNGGIISVVIYVALHISSIRNSKGVIATNLIISIYTNLLLGTISSVLVLSTFSMLPFFLIDFEKNRAKSNNGGVGYKRVQ